MTDTLTAELRHETWTVTDSEGGVWWPSATAEARIEASADPEAEALRICRETPMLGTWCD